MLTGERSSGSDSSAKRKVSSTKAYEEKRCADDKGEDDPHDGTRREARTTTVRGETLRDLLAGDGAVNERRAIVAEVKDDIWVRNTCELMSRNGRGDTTHETSSKNESQGPEEGGIKADRDRHKSLGETQGRR